MARYFFDVVEPSLSARDHEGIEGLDKAAISEEALRALCEIVADQPDRYVNQRLCITVRDISDKVVFTAAMNLCSGWHRDCEGHAVAWR